MSYGTSLGITLPTVSVTQGPLYATQVNSALQTVINTLETKVTPSGMDINDDLNFKSGLVYNAALNLERATFENKDSAISAATFPVGLYVVGGELYYNDNAGNQVQVTLNGEVNVSTTGGITGTGYGESSVEVNWDSTNVAYRFRSGGGADDFADVVCNDVTLNDGSGNYLTIGAPSLSSDESYTLPSLPSSGTEVVTLTSAGVMSTGVDLALGDITVDSIRSSEEVVYRVSAAGASGTNIAHNSTNPGILTSADSPWIAAVPLMVKEGASIEDVSLEGTGGYFGGIIVTASDGTSDEKVLAGDFPYTVAEGDTVSLFAEGASALQTLYGWSVTIRDPSS